MSLFKVIKIRFKDAEPPRDFCQLSPDVSVRAAPVITRVSPVSISATNKLRNPRLGGLAKL